jgi:hypothetical protein
MAAIIYICDQSVGCAETLSILAHREIGLLSSLSAYKTLTNCGGVEVRTIGGLTARIYDADDTANLDIIRPADFFVFFSPNTPDDFPFHIDLLYYLNAENEKEYRNCFNMLKLTARAKNELPFRHDHM